MQSTGDEVTISFASEFVETWACGGVGTAPQYASGSLHSSYLNDGISSADCRGNQVNAVIDGRRKLLVLRLARDGEEGEWMQKSSIVVAAPRLFLLRGSCRRRCGRSGRGGRRLCARRSGAGGLGGGRILSLGRRIVESGGVLENTAGAFANRLPPPATAGVAGPPPPPPPPPPSLTPPPPPTPPPPH